MGVERNLGRENKGEDDGWKVKYKEKERDEKGEKGRR